jgi:Arc/MetJ-type ribon-helix-helix transcriptional regulator
MNMKRKISISIDEETLLKILGSIKQGKFRNKSHAIEYAINNLLRK